MSELAEPTEITILCDRCADRLVVNGDSLEEAHAKLRIEIAAKQWRVTDRVAALMQLADGTTPKAQVDLCYLCAIQT